MTIKPSVLRTTSSDAADTVIPPETITLMQADQMAGTAQRRDIFFCAEIVLLAHFNPDITDVHIIASESSGGS